MADDTQVLWCVDCQEAVRNTIQENIDSRVVCLYRPYAPEVVPYLDHLFVCPGPHHAIWPEV